MRTGSLAGNSTSLAGNSTSLRERRRLRKKFVAMKLLLSFLALISYVQRVSSWKPRPLTRFFQINKKSTKIDKTIAAFKRLNAVDPEAAVDYIEVCNLSFIIYHLEYV